MGYDVENFIRTVKNFLKDDQIILDREGLSHYSYDATEIHHMPHVVVLPRTTEEVSKVMKVAYDLEIPVTPQGGRTGLSGGALPVVGGIVLSTMKMNRIIEIDTKNFQIVVEPGVIAKDLQDALEKYNLFFPPDPSSTVESTIGGNVGENAGYTRAVKYGVTRDYVLGLEAVLPDGTVINVGGRTVKNVTGYDLVALLIGSEGTLAIITKIICKVLPMPTFRRTCIVYLDDIIAAGNFVVSIFEKGIVPSAIELMDNYCINAVADYLPTDEVLRRDAEVLVLVEVDGRHKEAVNDDAELIIGLAQKNHCVIESRLAINEAEAQRLWRIRRDTLPALKAKGSNHLEADVVVPRYKLPFLIRAIKEIEKNYIVKVATFGHAGDGNLHVTIQYRKGNFKETEQAFSVIEEIYKKTLAMNGRLTGEHGVGITVKNYLALQMTHEEIELMKRIKKAFDPKGLLNPKKIFPE